ncbi:MAG: glycine zipper 2TM domain-containing protein [Gammaproteobacteria bacterium]|nr:glycine zipper 2TM domain-containing protein [Gammaproteobacteria bacterium]NND37637.1 glycine zipper 2TM domain-containing protein [Gammaproteobacteria bacterium]
MANLKRTARNGSIAIVGLLGVTILSFPATGSADNRRNDSSAHYDYARVTHVQPITRIVQVSTPHEVCWNERVRTVSDNGGRGRGRGRDREFAPTVLGGIIGGVVGNQFGSGRGNTAMTVAGALLGASIGRDASARNHHSYRRPARVSYSTERRCEVEQVTHQEERIDGYRVSYRFRGRDYVTRMNTDPGDRIRVRVEVDPV